MTFREVKGSYDPTDSVPATRLEVLIDEVLMFEKRLTVVRLLVVTFRLTFADVVKMLLVVKALVKMAFPEMYKFARVPPRAVETTIVDAFILALFMLVANVF